MKTLKLLALAMVLFLLFAAPALAQSHDTPNSATLSGSGVGAGIAVALVIVGAGYGFGKIGAAALEGIARQPEMAGNIRTTMIIIGALLEGATFFALIVCILLLGNARF